MHKPFLKKVIIQWWFFMADISRELETIYELLTGLAEDNTIPRNIRQTIKESLQKLQSTPESEFNVALSSVIYKMDDMGNDVNMPSHTRTEIWSIISQLESIKEKTK